MSAELLKLRNGKVLLNLESPAGLYTGPQLSGIASLMEEDMAMVRASEDQRLMLFVSPENLQSVEEKLSELGLASRPFLQGLHQPLACIGVLCPQQEQDAMDAASELTKELSGIQLQTPLKIGINGCGRCCVPSHTMDISVIADGSSYRMSIGGKTAQLPEMARFLAEGIPPDKIVEMVAKVVKLYEEQADHGEEETLYDLLERSGSSAFVEALAPYSQDAAADDDPFANVAAPEAIEPEEQGHDDSLAGEEQEGEAMLDEGGDQDIDVAGDEDAELVGASGELGDDLDLGLEDDDDLALEEDLEVDAGMDEGADLESDVLISQESSEGESDASDDDLDLGDDDELASLDFSEDPSEDPALLEPEADSAEAVDLDGDGDDLDLEMEAGDDLADDGADLSAEVSSEAGDEGLGLDGDDDLDLGDDDADGELGLDGDEDDGDELALDAGDDDDAGLDLESSDGDDLDLSEGTGDDDLDLDSEEGDALDLESSDAGEDADLSLDADDSESELSLDSEDGDDLEIDSDIDEAESEPVMAAAASDQDTDLESPGDLGEVDDDDDFDIDDSEVTAVSQEFEVDDIVDDDDELGEADDALLDEQEEGDDLGLDDDDDMDLDAEVDDGDDLGLGSEADDDDLGLEGDDLPSDDDAELGVAEDDLDEMEMDEDFAEESIREDLADDSFVDNEPELEAPTAVPAAQSSVGRPQFQFSGLTLEPSGMLRLSFSGGAFLNLDLATNCSERSLEFGGNQIRVRDSAEGLCVSLDGMEFYVPKSEGFNAA